MLTSKDGIWFVTIFVINSVGRGMKSGENFELLYNLAEKFNAAGEI